MTETSLENHSTDATVPDIGYSKALCSNEPQREHASATSEVTNGSYVKVYAGKNKTVVVSYNSDAERARAVRREISRSFGK